MSERLLFVPSWSISPRTAEEIPGVRAALDDFRAHFRVEVFVWPWIKDGVEGDCSVEGQIEALRSQLTDEDHVVVMGAGAQQRFCQPARRNGRVPLWRRGSSRPAQRFMQWTSQHSPTYS